MSSNNFSFKNKENPSLQPASMMNSSSTENKFNKPHINTFIARKRLDLASLSKNNIKKITDKENEHNKETLHKNNKDKILLEEEFKLSNASLKKVENNNAVVNSKDDINSSDNEKHIQIDINKNHCNKDNKYNIEINYNNPIYSKLTTNASLNNLSATRNELDNLNTNKIEESFVNSEYNFNLIQSMNSNNFLAQSIILSNNNNHNNIQNNNNFNKSMLFTTSKNILNTNNTSNSNKFEVCNSVSKIFDGSSNINSNNNKELVTQINSNLIKETNIIKTETSAKAQEIKLSLLETRTNNTNKNGKASKSKNKKTTNSKITKKDKLMKCSNIKNQDYLLLKDKETNFLNQKRKMNNNSQTKTKQAKPRKNSTTITNNKINIPKKESWSNNEHSL